MFEMTPSPIRVPTLAATPRIPQILDEFLAGQLTEGTRKIYERDVLAFFDGVVPTAEQIRTLMPAQIVAWRNQAWNNGHGVYEAATINRKLTSLKTFYDYLVALAVVQHNPCDPKLVKRIKVKSWRPQLGLEIEELQAILQVCRKDADRAAGMRDYALISLGYSGLLRRSEMANFRWRDLKRDGGRCILHLPLTKGGANDFVPVEQEVLLILDAYFKQVGPLTWKDGFHQENPGVPWGPKSLMDCPVFVALDNCTRGCGLSGAGINEVVKKRAKQARLMSGVHAHTLRHTGITHLLAAGEPLVKVQELARHSDPKITMQYYALLGRMKNSPTKVLTANLFG